jgi:hypothetical protein
MCLIKGAFVGEKNFERCQKMHGTTIKIKKNYFEYLFLYNHSYNPNLPATCRFRNIEFHCAEKFVIKLTRTKSNAKPK